MARYSLRNRKRNYFEVMAGLSVVAWLIIANVLVYISLIILATNNSNFLNYFALKPSNIIHGKYLFTLIVHMFAHVAFAHLFVNMFVLFSLGSLCERIVGRKRFFWFYIVSGLFAGILSVALSVAFGNTEIGAKIFGSPEIFMVGASGAIFGIAGLYAVLLPRLKFSIIFLPFWGFPGYILIPAVLFGLWILSAVFNWPIGNVAHFGGFLVGVGYGYYLRNKYRRKVAMLQRMFR